MIFFPVTNLNLLQLQNLLTGPAEICLMKQHCVIWKCGLLHSEHVNDANPGITGTFSRCNYITQCWGSPQPEILLRVNPVTFIIRPGGEESSELLWNEAELKSFVFQKMAVDQTYCWFQEHQPLQAICYETYGCCLKQTTIIHIICWFYFYLVYHLIPVQTIYSIISGAKCKYLHGYEKNDWHSVYSTLMKRSNVFYINVSHIWVLIDVFYTNTTDVTYNGICILVNIIYHKTILTALIFLARNYRVV